MIERVRANETGIQNRTYKRYQMLEAVTDPVVWCYVMLQLTSTLIIGGLGVFSNLIIASFGFTYLQTQLLNIAQGAVTIIVMVGSASLATWTKQTAWVMHAWTVWVLAKVKRHICRTKLTSSAVPPFLERPSSTASRPTSLTA
jgi:hypothetical protein